MARNQFETLIPVARESRLAIDGDVRAIAPLADGALAVLFQGPSGPLDSALQLQRFSVTGRPLGPAAGVGPTGAPSGAGVAEGGLTPLADGGVLATWITAFSHSLTPQFARFDAAGAHVGGAFGVTGQASSLAAAALPGGGFAVAEAATDLFGQAARIVLQRFTADGAATTTVLAAREDPFGGLFYNAVQVLADGGALQVLWTSRDGVHAARLEADGVVTETLLSDGFAADLDTARLADGRIVATWAEPDGAGARIRAAVFDPASPDGVPPAEIAVGRTPVFSGFAEPEVVALRDGGWAVSWRDGDPGGGTLARTFGPQGGASGVFQAHGDFFGTDANGRVLSARVDADGDVFVARYNVVTAPFWISGLDRIPVRQIGQEPRLFDTEWAF